MADQNRKLGPDTSIATMRLALLRPYLDGEATLTQVAADAGVPLRTAQRWVTRYRRDGPVGLARPARSDAGAHKIIGDLIALIEGLALTKPRLSVATIHRRVSAVARGQNWQAPSYGSVHSVIRALDPGMLTLAHEGAAVFRDRYEIVHRHRAERPNATWQADHTQLDIIILDANGDEARPCLTTVLDDHSCETACKSFQILGVNSVQ